MPNDADHQKPNNARRWLGKDEAVRHLLHSAIRMFMDGEDPFAIHLLVHSAEKLLIDIAKRKGAVLAFDWEHFIKPEAHAIFFEKHRLTYNYFKHADRDFGQELPVDDIMMLNVMTLFICCANYTHFYGQRTNHMMGFVSFMRVLEPHIFNIPEQFREAHDAGIRLVEGMTPANFFDSMSEARPKFDWSTEEAADLVDHGKFYETPIAELRDLRTRSHAQKEATSKGNEKKQRTS